ncbi:MAG: hypothetical protein ACRDJW_18085 [Thermomicrobiales bacterium]
MDESTLEPQEQTFDEAIARYYGEWVLMKVTVFNQYTEPVRGFVLAYSPSRRDISEVLKKQPARSELPPESPYQPYYTFKAFPRTHVGETYEQAVARFAEQRAVVTR